MPNTRSLLGFPLTAILAAIALLAYAFSALESSLSIDLLQPSWIKAHQLVGCHLLHWSAEHLIWDIGMFCLLGGICEVWWPKRYYAAVALSAVVIPLAILLFQPAISSYRGLSGIDSAIFSLLATTILLDSLRASDWPLALLFGCLLSSLAGKVMYEYSSGGLMFVSDTNFIPLPLAHLVGGIIGAMVACSCRGVKTVVQPTPVC